MCSQLIVDRSDGTRPLEALEREITALASQIHAATCRWLGLLAEYDAREGWAQWGCRSCAHWVAWQCGIAPGAAREHVRVARRLVELPLIRAAFAEGQLSHSKVRASRAWRTSSASRTCSTLRGMPPPRSSSGS
jgi:hypothetical protein